MRLILQLISGITRVLHKLVKYFDGSAITASFVFLLFRSLTVIFALDLN